MESGLCKIGQQFNENYGQGKENQKPGDTEFLSERGKSQEKKKECEKCLECETVCNFCVEGCPSRANRELILSDGSRQVLHIDEFCDGCGACESLFLYEEDFKNSENDGFYVTGEANNCRFRIDGNVLKYDPINGPLGIIPDELREIASLMMKKYPRFLKND